MFTKISQLVYLKEQETRINFRKPSFVEVCAHRVLLFVHDIYQ